MKYRNFGNTDILVSALGFGAMRLPTVEQSGKEHVDLDKAVPMLIRGLDLGINYIDTAFRYLNHTSEKAVGQAIAGRDRNRLYISTKNMIDTDAKAYRKRLDRQMESLNTDYIDFYHIHGLRWNIFHYKAGPQGHLNELRRAQDEGLIRHLSFSSHDTPENIIKLIDTGEFSSMLVQYNLLHRYNEAAIFHAREKGMGVAVMGPLGGGRISFLSRLKPREGRTLPELAFRFVLSNPNVSVALSGMNTIQMIEENTTIADNDGQLSSVEKEDIQQMLDQIQGLEDLYCTGCSYCMPCPNGVDIPTNLLLLNYIRLYGTGGGGFEDGFIQLYHQRLKPAESAAEFCAECGECLDKCPQNIQISDRMKEVAEELSKLE